MNGQLAVTIAGALAAVVIALVAFAVVIGVCFVVLRLISFVVSGSDERESEEPEGSETSLKGPGSET